SCICSARAIAIGNMMDTAAGFVTSDVKKIVTKNNSDNTVTGPHESPAYISHPATMDAAPDFSSATPIASEHTNTISKFRSSSSRTFGTVNRPKSTSRARTTIDTVNNGKIPATPVSNTAKVPIPSQVIQDGRRTVSFLGIDR